MKLILILIGLIVVVLLCDKNEDHLPQPIKGVYALWKKFSHVLGIIMSFIILTILWIVGFGVYAIVMKVITLPKRLQADPDSYWIDAEPSTTDSMKHQF